MPISLDFGDSSQSLEDSVYENVFMNRKISLDFEVAEKAEYLVIPHSPFTLSFSYSHSFIRHS